MAQVICWWCMCGFFLWVLSFPNFRADYLWISCCVVRRGRTMQRRAVGHWCSTWSPSWSRNHPIHHLFGPFWSFTLMIKASLEKSNTDSYVAGKNVTLGLEMVVSFVFTRMVSDRSVLLPSSLSCMKSLAVLGSGREQSNMVISNANNSRWQENSL